MPRTMPRPSSPALSRDRPGAIAGLTAAIAGVPSGCQPPAGAFSTGIAVAVRPPGGALPDGEALETGQALTAAVAAAGYPAIAGLPAIAGPVTGPMVPGTSIEVNLDQAADQPSGVCCHHSI